jgi:hypothetical protein
MEQRNPGWQAINHHIQKTAHGSTQRQHNQRNQKVNPCQASDLLELDTRGA